MRREALLKAIWGGPYLPYLVSGAILLPVRSNRDFLLSDSLLMRVWHSQLPVATPKSLPLPGRPRVRRWEACWLKNHWRNLCGARWTCWWHRWAWQAPVPRGRGHGCHLYDMRQPRISIRGRVLSYGLSAVPPYLHRRRTLPSCGAVSMLRPSSPASPLLPRQGQAASIPRASVRKALLWFPHTD